MKNVKITNMDNGVILVISKEQFETSKSLLSENTVYEYTDMPLTTISMPRQCGKSTSDLKYLSKVLDMIGGLKNEIDRTTIIRL